MKLAEALILRADQQKRLQQLKQRLLANARVQEGDEPAEDPNALLKEFNLLAGELEKIIQRINRTNARTELESGMTLSDALARRDLLELRSGAMRELGGSAQISASRYTRSEVKFVSTVDVAQIQRQADQLAKEHRELDARIQALNWQTELAE